MSDRYNTTYYYGETPFTLTEFTPTSDQCRYLILKILEQTIRVYVSMKMVTEGDKNEWNLAKDFLFDDNYRLDWGDLILSPEDFLEIVDLDIHWVREKAQKQFEEARRNG